MRVLFLGDVVGPIGLQAVETLLPSLKERLSPHLSIVNGENASKGRGLTRADYNRLKGAGADVITLGNHFLDKKQISSFIDDCPDLLRPVNSSDYSKGQGVGVYETSAGPIAVISVLLPAFVQNKVDNPFEVVEKLLPDLPPVRIIDLHGESTSEKQLFYHYFRGKCSAILGTHTHVMTADADIKDGTAFMADVGMCGEADSIIGVDPDSAIRRIIKQDGTHFHCNETGVSLLCGAYLEIEANGKANKILPFRFLDHKEIAYEPLPNHIVAGLD